MFFKKRELDVNSGPDSCGQWKKICTWYDISRAELLKYLVDEIVSSWAGQTSHDRRRETCKDWPMIITISICSLFLFLDVLILPRPFLCSWANSTSLYQEVLAVPTDEGAKGAKSFCLCPHCWKCPVLPSSPASGTCTIQFKWSKSLLFFFFFFEE